MSWLLLDTDPIQDDTDVSAVTEALLAVCKGSYQEHVALYLDSPGVWSGAELAGKARRYGARYFESRYNLMTRAGCEACWRLNPNTGRKYRSVRLA